MIHLIVALGLLLFVSVQAFSGGAGFCNANRAAVGTTHLFQQNVTRGSLAEGSIHVTLSYDPQQQQVELLTANSLDILELNQDYQLCVHRKQGYKGILIRWAGSPDDLAPTAMLSPTDDDNYYQSFTCDIVNAGSVTHNNNKLKYQTCAEIAPLTKPAATAMKLDITIVVQNRDGFSEFYHSQFLVNAGTG